jgi:hypothetical protein
LLISSSWGVFLFSRKRAARLGVHREPPTVGIFAASA